MVLNKIDFIATALVETIELRLKNCSVNTVLGEADVCLPCSRFGGSIRPKVGGQAEMGTQQGHAQHC